MEVTKPSLAAADALVEMWVSLATSQRQHGSHLLASENRARIRESICHHIAAGRLLVVRDDLLCGFVMFRPEFGIYEQDRERGIIENIYVKPEYRDEGVGTMLLEAAEEELLSQGVDVISLEVLAANERAQKLYRSHGYEPHRIELEKRVSDDRS